MNEQEAYELGYKNPAMPSREHKWQHIVEVNAYRCGQLDYQNQAPVNRSFDRRDYDADTFERILRGAK